MIKVYEVNLRKYYLEGQTNIDDQVDLSFLIPTHQQVYEHVPTTPFQLCKTNIVLEKVPAKLGLFVVDLEGEGVVSRAVIRKGQIACVDSLTEAGQRLSFYDATGRPLGIANNMQLWVRGKPCPLSEGNTAFLEYSSSEEQGVIIASIENYAERLNLSFHEEKYDFSVGFLFNEESFTVGKKAKILLNAQLALRGVRMSL